MIYASICRPDPEDKEWLDEYYSSRREEEDKEWLDEYYSRKKGEEILQAMIDNKPNPFEPFNFFHKSFDELQIKLKLEKLINQ
ncbi:MAG: hypothetical protein A2271_05095 [Candidatus Moranbacteria bacterium RIFOXYA12_FULL_35_19]|nr:MAG: hypothetical protein UR78_C0018G0015 [Candidatus Moranbacteria bacterium GW2011_GWF2_35_39]OGI32116.1 MAG: hypothetical protein A2489_02055 [Candidatus Moranbacteria bacterium RIFOXYC12_FULL_36_13]OGI35084.1 MAG: hypothetical protein A2271_05095 [Candidatus Moranbacteria bacterium RIFOXYA12_FULL_35_19]